MRNWKMIKDAPYDGSEVMGIFYADYSMTKPTIYGPWSVRWNGRKWVSSWDGWSVVEYMSDFGTEYREPDMQPTHFFIVPEFDGVID